VKSWFIKFKPFILITTFVVITVPIVFYTLKDYSFKPITINNILSKLSPAGNLTGTWFGRATFKNADNPDFYCSFPGNVTLTLTQKGNKLNGQFVFAEEKGIPSNDDVACEEGTDSFQISAIVNGSRIEPFNIANDYGTFTGSFTSDTLILNQSKVITFELVGSINLIRQ